MAASKGPSISIISCPNCFFIFVEDEKGIVQYDKAEHPFTEEGMDNLRERLVIQSDPLADSQLRVYHSGIEHYCDATNSSFDWNTRSVGNVGKEVRSLFSDVQHYLFNEWMCKQLALLNLNTAIFVVLTDTVLSYIVLDKGTPIASSFFHVETIGDVFYYFKYLEDTLISENHFWVLGGELELRKEYEELLASKIDKLVSFSARSESILFGEPWSAFIAANYDIVT